MPDSLQRSLNSSRSRQEFSVFACQCNQYECDQWWLILGGWVVSLVWVKSHIIIIFYLDFHCGEIRFGHIIALLSVPFYWWVVSSFHLNLHEFPLSTFTCAFWRCSYKNNPTMQFTHLSQIYLPMINNFGRPTQALFRSRLPFGSLNKITTMRSVTRLQI